MVRIAGSCGPVVVATGHLDLPGVPPEPPKAAPPSATPAPGPPHTDARPVTEPLASPPATTQRPAAEVAGRARPCEVCGVPVAPAYIAKTGRALHGPCAKGPAASQTDHPETELHHA